MTVCEIAELAKYEKQKGKAKGKGKKKPPEKKRKPKKLSDQREAFCQSYVICHNKTQAAKDAKYSKKTAGSQGQRLLKNVEIQKRIAELEKPIVEKLDITAERVMTELANIAFFDPAELFDEDGNMKKIHDIPPEVRRVIAGIEVEELYTGRGVSRDKVGVLKKIKFCNKNKSLELLGKTNVLALFEENINHKFPDGCGVLAVPVQVSKKDWAKQAKNNSNPTHGGKNAKNNSSNAANSGSDSIGRG